MNLKSFVLFGSVVCSTFALVYAGAAQGTAFTYQGQLSDGGAAANGSYDLEFTLYATNNGGTPVTGTLTNTATTLSNGLFTAELDFGEGIFTGGTYWLEVDVRTNGGGGFTILSPRQQVNSSPYAIYAPNAGAAQTAASAAAVATNGTVPLSALPSAVVTNGARGVNISGTFSGNGGGLTNIPPQSVLNSPGLASISVALNTAPSPSSNYVYYPLDVLTASNFTIYGSSLIANPDYPYQPIPSYQTGATGARNVDITVLTVGFGIDGSQFIFQTWDYGQTSYVSVDGYDNGTGFTVGNGDGASYVTVNLITPGHHWIEIKNANNMFGVYVPITNGFFRNPPQNFQANIRLAVLGDSFVEGVPYYKWPDDIQEFGYGLNVFRLGEGGTGWNNVNAGSGYTNFLGRIGDLTNINPQYAIITGILNDGGYGAPATSNAYWNQVYNTAAAMKAALPYTQFAVCGIFEPRSVNIDSNWPVTSLLVSNACVAAGLIGPAQFIDPTVPPLVITGDSRGYPPTANVPGTSEIYIGPDYTHPTQLGHAAIAQWMIGKLEVIWPEIFSPIAYPTLTQNNAYLGSFTGNAVGLTNLNAATAFSSGPRVVAAGVVMLDSGTASVTNVWSYATNSIELTECALGAQPLSTVGVSNLVSGYSFQIQSSSVVDTNMVMWTIISPN